MDKKELIKRYKETVKPMGIFQIRNTKNGRVYVDSAKNLQGKINREKFLLKNKMHSNEEMQNDFSETGMEFFSFEILDYLEPKDISSRDYSEELSLLKGMWMEKLQPYGENGYHKRRLETPGGR